VSLEPRSRTDANGLMRIESPVFYFHSALSCFIQGLLVYKARLLNAPRLTKCLVGAPVAVLLEIFEVDRPGRDISVIRSCSR
jgi:hypothetical protein